MTNSDLLPLIDKKEGVLDSLTGFVEHYDFSKANSSYEARVQAVTKVASICYQSPKALGSVSLFDRLQAESAGLPSSSYEFVPILITNLSQMAKIRKAANTSQSLECNCEKYGEYLKTDTKVMGLLTNLRALIEDVGPEESLNYLNTSEEQQQIIRDNFKVFLFNVDVPTRTQMIRHRISWQELSRRYVSGKKSPFDFYISKKMENVTGLEFEDGIHGAQYIINMCVLYYNQAIASGVKPEEARRILPQAMLTTIWGAFQPKQLDTFFKLRLDKHAQKEIRYVAEAMEGLINENK